MIAAILARKSTDQAGVSDAQKSVTRQIDQTRACAVRKSWTVVDEHVSLDDGVSGPEFLKRPACLRIMNALQPRRRPRRRGAWAG